MVVGKDLFSLCFASNAEIYRLSVAKRVVVHGARAHSSDALRRAMRSGATGNEMEEGEKTKRGGKRKGKLIAARRPREVAEIEFAGCFAYAGRDVRLHKNCSSAATSISKGGEPRSKKKRKETFLAANVPRDSATAG